jgi:uncharacterized protein DUF5906
MADNFHYHFCRKLIRHCEPGLVWRRKGTGTYAVVGRDENNPQKALDFAASLLTEKHTLNETIRGHLGNAPIGISVNDKRGVTGHGKTRLLVFDLDDHDQRIGTEFETRDAPSRLLAMQRIGEDIVAALSERGIKPFTVVSGGGRGVHVWALFSEFADAQKVCAFGGQVLAGIERDVPLVSGTGGVARDDGKHHIEVFPKSSRHSNIALPLARKSYLYMSDGTGGFTEYDQLDPEDKRQAYGAIFANLNSWPEDLLATPSEPEKKSRRAKAGGKPLKPSSGVIDYGQAFTAFESQHDWREYEGWIAATARVVAATKEDSEFANFAYDLWAARSAAERDKWDKKASSHWHSLLSAESRVSPRTFWYDARRGGYTGAVPWGERLRDVSYPDPKPDSASRDLDVATVMGERGYSRDEIRHELNRLFNDDWDEALLDDISVNPVPPVLDYDQHVAPMNEDWAQVTEAKSAFIYLKSGDLKAKDGFLDANAHLMLAGPRGGRISVAQEWLKDPHRNYYIGVTVADPETHVNCRGGLLNALKPIPHAAAAGDVEPFLRHLRHLTAMSGHEAYEVLVDFLADMVQRPAATDSQIAVMITGGQGTGKSTLGRLMKAVMGDARYLHLNGNDELFHQYNAFQLGVVLLFCDEVVFAGDAKAQNRLKAMITEADRMTEGKNLPVIRAPNVSRIIAATNNVHALSLEPDDRRWLILNVPRKPDYCLDEFNQWAMRPENAAAILDFLSHRDVDVKRLRAAAPMTAAKREQLVMSDPILAAFIEIAESGVCPHDRYGTGQIATQTLGELVRGNARFPSDREIVQTVRNQWPEVQKRRSKRISRFTGDYKSRDDDTVSVTALWAPGDVSGFSFGDLRRFRAAVSERAGFEIPHQDGDAWLCWQPPQQGAVDLRAGTGVDGRGDGEPPF